MEYNSCIPELTVYSIEETRAFYTKLGFQVAYERPDESFLFMSFEGSQFMFEELHADGWNLGTMQYPLGQGINFSIAVKDIDSLYRQVKAHGFPLYRDLHISNYEVSGEVLSPRQFLLQDPNGYLLRFTT